MGYPVEMRPQYQGQIKSLVNTQFYHILLASNTCINTLLDLMELRLEEWTGIVVTSRFHLSQPRCQSVPPGLCPSLVRRQVLAGHNQGEMARYSACRGASRIPMRLLRLIVFRFVISTAGSIPTKMAGLSKSLWIAYATRTATRSLTFVFNHRPAAPATQFILSVLIRRDSINQIANPSLACCIYLTVWCKYPPSLIHPQPQCPPSPSTI